MLVGAKDYGTLSELKVSDELIKNLSVIRADGNVQPLPAITAQKYALAEEDLAVVEVLPSELPPVKYRGRV